MPIRIQFAVAALAFGASALSAQARPTQSSQSSADATPPKARLVTSVEGISEYALPNGMRVLLFPDPSRTTITVTATYLVGGGDEGVGESGMAHLLEHMLFLGSKRHPKLLDEYTARGSRRNAQTGRDATWYYQTLPAVGDNLEWMIDVEADRMLNAFIAKKDLDTEFSVVRNELEAGENNLFELTALRVFQLGYDWHHYGRKIIGTVSDIENVPVDRLQAFYKRYYQPDNAYLTVSGRFDPVKTLALIERAYAPIPKPVRSVERGNVLARRYTVEPTQDGERYGAIRRAGTAQWILVGYHIPAVVHPDFAPLHVLSDVLFSNPSGRLYKEIVDTRQAAFLSGSVFPLADATMMMVQARLRLDQSLDSVRIRMERMIDSARIATFTDEEIARAKTSLQRNVDLQLGNSEALSTHLSDWMSIGDWRLFFYHRDQLAKVTKADVQRVAAAYLKSSNRTTAVFIPTDKADRAEIPAKPAVAATLAGYTGGPAPEMGELFDASARNIEARTKRSTLASGMNLSLLSKRTRNNKVRGQITLRYGTEASLTGNVQRSLITMAMLSRGTTQLTRQAVIDSLSKLSAAVTITGALNATIVTIDAPRRTLVPVLELVAQQLRAPRFDADEFDRLKKERAVGTDVNKGNPINVGDYAIARKLSPVPVAHPLARPTFDEELAAMNAVTVESVREFHQSQFGATYADLALVGDFDAPEIEAVAARLFGDWKNAQPFERMRRTYVPIDSSVESIEMPDKPNAAIYIGMNMPIRDDDPDYPALALAHHIFGGTAGTSRLPGRLRQKEGISYGTVSSLTAQSFDRFANWTAAAILAPQNADRALRALREEIDRMRTEGFTADEVQQFKTSFATGRIQSLANDAELVGILVTRRNAGRTVAYDEDLARKVSALTVEQVNAAARKYFDPRHMVVVRVGDFAKNPPPSTRPTP